MADKEVYLGPSWIGGEKDKTKPSSNKLPTVESTSPVENGRIIYSSQHSGDLDNFLSKNQPSKLTSNEAAWIQVMFESGSNNDESSDSDDDTANRHETMMDMWEQLVRSGARNVTAKKIEEIAIKTKCVVGKWMVFCETSHIDERWSAIAKAVVQGKLGRSAKVSTKNENESHVICVYTEDFTDVSDCMRVETELRKLGIIGRLNYKADIYTYFGIYAKNNWAIRPTIYTTLP